MRKSDYNECLKMLREMFRSCPQWVEYPEASFEDYIVGEYYQEKKALILIGKRVYNKLLSLPKDTIVSEGASKDIIAELMTDTKYVLKGGYLFVIKIFCDILKISTKIALQDISGDLVDFDAKSTINIDLDELYGEENSASAKKTSGDKGKTDSDKGKKTSTDGGKKKKEPKPKAPSPVYKISYNANGGVGAPMSQTRTNKTNAVLSWNYPKRSGYLFLGWSTSRAASSPTYYPGSVYYLDSSVTLYAVWTFVGWNKPLHPRVDNELKNKIFAVFLPILMFIIGQIIEYSVYSLTGSVFIMDLIFTATPMPVLIVSSVLGAISTVHIAVRSWKLADEDEGTWCWTYIIATGVLFAVMPCAWGYLGIIITSGISYALENIEEERVPYFVVLPALLVGQIIMWVQYVKTGYILFIGDFFGSGIGVSVFAVLMSIVAVIAAFIVSNSIYEMETAPAILTAVSFCLLLLVAPTLSAIPLLVCAIITSTNDDEDVQMWTSGSALAAIVLALLISGVMAIC